MSTRPRILDFLLHSPEVAADQALIAALLNVEPSLQTEVVHILLGRGREVGLEALPGVYDQLDVTAQAAVVASTARCFSALRTTIRSGNVKTRLNTVDIVRHSGNLRLAYIAAHAVHDGAPQVRAEAAATLKYLANKHRESYAETAAALHQAAKPDKNLSRAAVGALNLLREERQHLIAALAEAINCYESHYRPEILEAALLFADELEGKLFQQPTVKRGKLCHAMLDIFVGSPSPRLAPFAYVALCYPELRRGVVSLLARHRHPDFFADFIRHHWLARDPAIRKNLLNIHSISWLEEGLEAAFGLPSDAAAMAPGWLLHLGIPSGQKVALLLNFLLLDDPAANRAAVWALIKTDIPAATLALQSVLDHEDPDVRKLAEREVAYRLRRDNMIVRRPRKDRPEEWTNLLDRAGLSEEFDDLWAHFERLNPVQAKQAGHHAVTYVPGFVAQLQVKLRSPQTMDRLRGLRLLLLLNLTERFKNDVFSVANDQSPELRATATTILGQIADVTSRRILERALGDDDPSVQAAAVEALDNMGFERRVQLVAPKADSEHAEVRAAAIRCLLKLRFATAATALISMLQDIRPDHRCAALWVADQLRLETLAPRILEIAKTDKDPRIARIAEHVARRLRRTTQSSARPVPPVRHTAPLPVHVAPRSAGFPSPVSETPPP